MVESDGSKKRNWKLIGIVKLIVLFGLKPAQISLTKAGRNDIFK